MSAVGFRVAAVDPAMGRYFRPEDERPAAPKVVVLGDDVWRRRFGADPGIVGREIRLGDSFYSVIGVMPGATAPAYASSLTEVARQLRNDASVSDVAF